MNAVARALRHEHLHLFDDGLRRLVHKHSYPESLADPHQHKNGGHIHPHGHDGYEPVPSGEARRPIIAANGWPQPEDPNAQ